MTYEAHVKALQSRLSKRAAKINSTEQWKLLYRAQQQMVDYKNAKLYLEELHESQMLDKKLLKALREVSKPGMVLIDISGWMIKGGCPVLD